MLLTLNNSQHSRITVVPTLGSCDLNGVHLIVVQSEGSTPGTARDRHRRPKTWDSDSKIVYHHPLWILPLYIDGDIAMTMLLNVVCEVTGRRWGPWEGISALPYS